MARHAVQLVASVVICAQGHWNGMLSNDVPTHEIQDELYSRGSCCKVRNNLDLGPLELLVGKWMGVGQNIISVPQADESENFTILQQNYSESLTFEAIPAPVKNRGYKAGDQLNVQGQSNELLSGVTYNQVIHDVDTSDLLHVESGQLMYRVAAGLASPWEVMRMGSIPHGTVVMALGNASYPESVDFDLLLEEYRTDPPESDKVCEPVEYFTQHPNIEGTNHTCDYVSNPACLKPATLLQDRLTDLTNQNVTIQNVTKLNLTTSQAVELLGGGLLNSPFINVNAKAIDFRVSMHILTVDDGQGGSYDLLQYAQLVQLEFLQRFDCRGCAYVASQISFGCKNAFPQCLPNSTHEELGPAEDCAAQRLIRWPHVMVNTLRRAPASPEMSEQPRVVERLRR